MSRSDEAERPLHFSEQIEDLSLNRHVERRGRLVRNHERGPTRKGDGDHDALALTAGKLVRVVMRAPGGFGNSHRLYQLDGLGTRGIPSRAPVHHQRLRNLIADGEDGIQRRHRLLEDQRDFAAAEPAQLALAERHQVASAKVNRAAEDAARRLHQPHDRECRHRLAAPGLADKRQRLALSHAEAHVVHGDDRAAASRKARREILDF